MTVQWDIGQPRVDVGQQFQQGMEHGRVVRQQADRTNALRGYAANPNDPGAQNALLMADPALSLQFRDQRIQEQHAQHQQALEALGEHRDRIIMGAQFLQGVHDEAGYQQALGLARQNGIPIDDVPPHYDQGYVSNLLSVAQHLQAVQHPMAPTDMQRNYSWLQQNHPEQAGSYLTRETDPQPFVIDNGDGTRTIVPRGAPPQGQPAGGLPHVSTQEERARLAPGAQYIAPDGSIRTVPGGAPQPQAAGTFR